MKRLWFIVAVVGLFLVVASVAVPATAQEFDRHPHILVQRPEFGLIDGVPHLIAVRKCVDLAANRTVPLHAHHERLHFGTSGVSFGGGESGHVVAPAAPFPAPFGDPLPWGNCKEFEALLPLDVSD